MRPAAPNAQQVTSFETQQQMQAQRDEAERTGNSNSQLQCSSFSRSKPSLARKPQRRADDRRAASGDLWRQSECAADDLERLAGQAEAKQRQLAREKQQQDAINSDTVAIDFARGAHRAAAATYSLRMLLLLRWQAVKHHALAAHPRPAAAPAALRAAMLLQEHNSGQPVSAALQRSNPKRKTRWPPMTSTPIRAGSIASSREQYWRVL